MITEKENNLANNLQCLNFSIDLEDSIKSKTINNACMVYAYTKAYVDCIISNKIELRIERTYVDHFYMVANSLIEKYRLF